MQKRGGCRATRAITVLPGIRWYKVTVTRRSIVDILFFRTDAFYLDAECGFPLDGTPGSEYTLGRVDSGGQRSTNEHKVYRASLEIKERLADGPSVTLHIPIECANFSIIKHGWFERIDPINQGFLCQANADCPTVGAECVREADYAYGLCGRR
jgi:hypothetical protein